MLSSLKLFIISSAVIFTALGLKSYLPLATTHFTLIWNFFLLCFTPPYLYITVNAIIISIVASSRFHQSNHPMVDVDPTPPPPPVLVLNEPVIVDTAPTSKQEEEEEEEEIKQIDLGIMPRNKMESSEYLPPVDKPLVSTRFSHRKPLKFSPEGGKSLKVAKQKRNETLENTWKAITEGRSIPLSRHMKKCDTWQNRYEVGPHEDSTVSISDFNLNKNRKLRKEPSLSQDELNKRVEAFIHKFNQEMRLQRQQSSNQYMQIINRSTS